MDKSAHFIRSSNYLGWMIEYIYGLCFTCGPITSNTFYPPQYFEGKNVINITVRLTCRWVQLTPLFLFLPLSLPAIWPDNKWVTSFATQCTTCSWKGVAIIPTTYSTRAQCGLPSSNSCHDLEALRNDSYHKTTTAKAFSILSQIMKMVSTCFQSYCISLPNDSLLEPSHYLYDLQ